MAINLEKGQRINLEKSSGQKLTRFMVGCNWGALTTTKKVEIVDSEGFLGIGRKTHFENKTEEVDLDIDLSCVMVDDNGQLVDTLYSPLYNKNIYPKFFVKHFPSLPKGKDWSDDKSMYHTPDDTEGDKGGDDGLDNEIITVDLTKVDAKITQIFFFLDIFSPAEVDFKQVPYAVCANTKAHKKTSNESPMSLHNTMLQRTHSLQAKMLSSWANSIAKMANGNSTP